MTEHPKPRFAWLVSYRNCITYEFNDHTGRYLVQLRRAVEDWERASANPCITDEQWQHEVVDMVGVLRREYGCRKPIPAETLNAFNQWLKEERDALVAKYPNAASLPPPVYARAAAVWNNGRFDITAVAEPVEPVVESGAPIIVDVERPNNGTQTEGSGERNAAVGRAPPGGESLDCWQVPHHRVEV